MKRITSWLLAVVLGVALCACSGQQAPEQNTTPLTWQEQYDLGLRYLSEGNYTEAILAFTAAIEIDPKQALAYLGRGDTYFALGDTEMALLDYKTAADLGDSQAIEKLSKLNDDIQNNNPTPMEGYPKSERHDSWVNGEEGYSIADYNEFGNLIKLSFYLPDDVLATYSDYFYDEQQVLASVYNESIIVEDGGYATKSSTFLDANGRCYRKETFCTKYEETIDYTYTDTSVVYLTYQKIGHAGDWTDGDFCFSGLEFDMQSPEHVVLVGSSRASGIGGGSDTILEKRSINFGEYRIEDTNNGGIMNTDLCLQEIEYSFDAQNGLLDTKQII